MIKRCVANQIIIRYFVSVKCSYYVGLHLSYFYYHVVAVRILCALTCRVDLTTGSEIDLCVCSRGCLTRLSLILGMIGHKYTRTWVFHYSRSLWCRRGWWCYPRRCGSRHCLGWRPQAQPRASYSSERWYLSLSPPMDITVHLCQLLIFYRLGLVKFFLLEFANPFYTLLSSFL